MRGICCSFGFRRQGCLCRGTRFIATKQCPVHRNWKKALVGSDSLDPIMISHGRKTAQDLTDVRAEMRFGSVRSLCNEFSQRCLELVKEGKKP
jgi:hypothetical protein